MRRVRKESFLRRSLIAVFIILFTLTAAADEVPEERCILGSSGVFDLTKEQDCKNDPDHVGIAVVQGGESWTLQFRDLEAEGTAVLDLHPSDKRWWPTPVTLLLSKEGSGFEPRKILIPGNTATRFSLHLPVGEWTYLVAAQRYRDSAGVIEVLPNQSRQSRVILHRLDYISGKVLLEDRRPATGAELYAGEEPLGTIDSPDGSFFLAVPQEWDRSELRVLYAGLPGQRFSVPQVGGDTELGTLVFRKGVELAIETRLPAAFQGTAELVVSALVSRSKESPVFTRNLDKQTVSLREVVPAGRYRITLTGPEPLQRYGRTVEVSETSDRVALEVDPVQLELIVRDDASQAVSNAVALLVSSAGGWRQEVTTDVSGRGEWELWQRGAFALSARHPEAGSGYTERKQIADDTIWHVQMKGDRVEGTVVTQSGDAISGAKLLLVSTTATGQKTRVQDADDRGHFRFDYLQRGDHRLTVHHAGFDERTLEVQPEAEEFLRVVLSAQGERHVRVVSATGRPLAGAALITESSTYPSYTDHGGLVVVPLPGAGTARYFVVPREGSFAVIDINSESPEESTVTVPPGDATLMVGMKTTDGGVLGGKAFALRYNGTFLPLNVVRTLENLLGIRLNTDATGWAQLARMPSGFYELWPVFDFNLYPVLLQRPTAPAAAVYATPGVSTVEMTFNVSDGD